MVDNIIEKNACGQHPDTTVSLCVSTNRDGNEALCVFSDMTCDYCYYIRLSRAFCGALGKRSISPVERRSTGSNAALTDGHNNMYVAEQSRAATRAQTTKVQRRCCWSSDSLWRRIAEPFPSAQRARSPPTLRPAAER